MFSRKHIRLGDGLYERAAAAAAAAGYSSVDEFVVHLVEKELAALDPGQIDAEVLKQLRGLGYLE